MIEAPTRVDSRAIDEQVTEDLRADLARRLSRDVQLIKPCVARIPRQEQGTRGTMCHVLAVEYLRTGAEPDLVMSELCKYVERCAQPPCADHPFTERDVSATLKSVLGKERREGLRGYGCDSGPLRDSCPYGGDKSRCPYIRRMRREPKRQKLSTLLGTVNARRAHSAPAHWSERQKWRRRVLWDDIGALEVQKGYGGGELITSEKELVYRTQIAQTTLRRDLVAMAQAGWIRYSPGKSRKGRKGEPSVGTRIYRLYPEEALLAAVKMIFADSEEVE